jgi:hypothetical protein
MNKLLSSEIENYLKRSITDIARKCGVCDTDVINVIKNIGKNED